MNSTLSDEELKEFAGRIAAALNQIPVTIDEQIIEEMADLFAKKMQIRLTGQLRTSVLRLVQHVVLHSRPYSFSVFSEEYRPWFEAFWAANYPHPYWERYQTYLLVKKGMQLEHVRSLDSITSAIVDHLENPNKAGQWTRRGMVVGQVQSGKTANYIGVVCKAADCGYRLIVIMAGTLNALRNQTQYRVDEGFIGKATAGKNKGEKIGVGLDQTEAALHIPTHLTTSVRDFRKSSAETVGLSVGSTTEPIILVIKKNATTLKNLTDWLLTNNSAHALKDLPFLLIDDEADYAGINVRNEENTPTRINGQIRALLKLFGRSSYLGYTATPFANIFIDPDASDETFGDDLFPRDFILTLDAPDTYLGPKAFFLDTDRDYIHSIHDVEDLTGPLPIRHPKDFSIAELPDSLIDALHVFVLTKAIRLARGERGFDCSALVNASRFKDVHRQLNEKVSDVIAVIRDAVTANGSLDDQLALANSTMAHLKFLFETEFAGALEGGWATVKPFLFDAASNIEVLTVNSDRTAQKLDYSRENWPDGRTVVVVGGMSLSRGLTLEGLTVSYYLRNSIAYDTLMQMGRWFGYRPGYEDICRVYMTDLCHEWYSHIAMALDELFDEFRSMEARKLTPREFGLRVRAHPDAMIVTARNKMRTAQRIPIQLNYFGRLVETTKLTAVTEDHEKNRKLLAEWLPSLGKAVRKCEKAENGWLWHDVSASKVVAFIEAFKAHPLEELDKLHPVCEYIKSKSELEKWDIFLVSRRTPKNPGESAFEIGDISVFPESRWMKGEEHPACPDDPKCILLNGAKRRLGDAKQERAGLSLYMPPGKIDAAEENFLESHSAVTGNLYRRLRKLHGGNPLFVIHIVSAAQKPTDASPPPAFWNNLVAFSVAFPGDPVDAPKEKAVEYEVNRIWYQNYLAMRNEESDEYDDTEDEEEDA